MDFDVQMVEDFWVEAAENTARQELSYSHNNYS